MVFVPGLQDNHTLMELALEQAKKAGQIGEVPIGAVVVDPNGKPIGFGFNRVETQKTQTAHAEIEAIRQAAREIKDWRLNDCWLYVTLEPCMMCMGLIRLSRLAGVVYGAVSPLYGYHLDNERDNSVYKSDALHVISGVRDNEARELLKQFFEKKRKQSE